MNKWLQIAFGGIQAISALGLLLLALWAAFFTSLPEVLISKLRSEITEAKSEIAELRDQKGSIQREYASASQELTDLKLERDKLAGSIGDLRAELKQKEEMADELSLSNSELQSQGTALEQVISALRVERSELEDAVDVLRDERALYAGQTLHTNLSKVAAYACYRLSGHHYDAYVAANYSDHRAWLNANRRLSSLQAAYDSLSVQERYSEENQLAVEYRNLQELALSLPEIWLGLPSEPNLVPDAQPQFLGEHTTRLLNEIGGGDFEGLHNYLINLFFNRTILSERVRELTTATFVEELAALPFLGDLLDQERETLEEALMEFISEHPPLRDMVLNVVYQSEPSAGEIPEGARLVIRNLEQVRDEFLAFFTERGVTSFGECSFTS